MKKILIITTLLLVQLSAFAIEDCSCNHHHHKETDINIKDDSILTIKDCISIGVKNSPVIKEYAHRLEIAKSNVGIAKSAYFPEFSAGAGYRQEFNSNREEFSRNYRELPSVSVSLNKMIWDFGKTTANVKMEEFLKIAAEYEFEDIVCATVFNIKTHYYNLLRAKAEYETQKMNYDLQTKIAKEIQKLVSEGKKKQADLVNAQLRQYKAKVELNNSEVSYKNAKEELNNAIYLENAPDYKIYETQTFSYKPQKQNSIKNISYTQTKQQIKKDDTIFTHPKFTYTEAVEKAYKNSPDIKALVATKNSLEQALLLVKRSYYPELNAGVGYDFLNTNQFKNNGLSVGVSVESSINAMRQKYDIKGAKAQLELADTEIETFKKNLYFTVRKCLNNVNTTYKNISENKEKMQKASQYFDITYSNYNKNITSQLDLEYAKEVYINSINEYTKAEYKYNIALINLEMAMHYHLIDYHDDAEHAAEYHEGDENESLSKFIQCGKKHQK